VGKAVENAKQMVADGNTSPRILEVATFPHEYDKKGVCSKLGADNRCTIYDTRPNICRVSYVYKTYESGNMSEADYVIKLEEVCTLLDKKVNGEPVVS